MVQRLITRASVLLSWLLQSLSDNRLGEIFVILSFVEAWVERSEAREYGTRREPPRDPFGKRGEL